MKLADYGVSRVVLPSGTKGLAGTLPFMAPEIILQNGEETYTEKVLEGDWGKVEGDWGKVEGDWGKVEGVGWRLW